MSRTDPTIDEVRPVASDVRRLCRRHRWMARLGLLRIVVVDIEGVGRVTLAVRDHRDGAITTVCGG